jgi:hypothetical protein
MLVIVGKATPNSKTGDVERYLKEFWEMYQSNKRFVYAWSFNPDERAIDMIKDQIKRQEDIFLYLPFDGRRSKLRMHIIDLYHDRNGAGTCPARWNSHCISALQGYQNWGVHLWFLIDMIEDLFPPVDLLNTFTAVIPDKYREWGRNYFAFFV